MRVTAIEGDTVDLLCQRHLGRTAAVAEAVLATNPGLAALGPILPLGTPVDLPDVVAAPPPTLVQLWD
jgi:phage tail protein X